MTEEKKVSEKMVCIYDPVADAFKEVPESLARKFVESAKDVERQLEEK